MWLPLCARSARIECSVLLGLYDVRERERTHGHVDARLREQLRFDLMSAMPSNASGPNDSGSRNKNASNREDAYQRLCMEGDSILSRNDHRNTNTSPRTLRVRAEFAISKLWSTISRGQDTDEDKTDASTGVESW